MNQVLLGYRIVGQGSYQSVPGMKVNVKEVRATA